jgi:hypothetical protein
MKRIILTFLFCGLTTLLLAQQWVEVVYLKNGGQVRGVIIEQVPNETLKIQTADGSIFVYKMSEVEKITKEQPKQHSPLSSNYESSTLKPTANRIYDENPEKKNYNGRKKEAAILINPSIGIATSEWVELFGVAAFQTAMENVVPSEYWSDFRCTKSIGFALRAGVDYSRYFKKGSPLFWEVGAFAELDRTGMGVYFQGARVFKASFGVWNFAACGGVGVQLAPNKEGMHFYMKAGMGYGYVSTSKLSIIGYGEAAGLAADWETGFDDGSFHVRPYAELGLGGDNFFRIGLRYSPLIVNDMKIWSHCFSLSVNIPVW